MRQAVAKYFVHFFICLFGPGRLGILTQESLGTASLLFPASNGDPSQLLLLAVLCSLYFSVLVVGS